MILFYRNSYFHGMIGNMNRAFSLVELSIVLVILGLLAGGVVAGQSLIRAAELRSVVADQQRFATAISTFKDKYFAIPGDMSNATTFWGKDNAACTAHTGTAATPGTCNGNGDARMNTAAAAGATAEAFQFWKQLALAGLIESAYTGLSGSGSFAHAVRGTNVPASKIGQAAWYTSNADSFPGNTNWWALDYGNYISIGVQSAAGQPWGYTFTPEEAWNIDHKLDDGKPATGRVIGIYWNNQCSAADDGFPANDDYAASYRVSDPTRYCVLLFPKAY
jgi:prepilin-type N-terminal cleavage/methylation domain-containing protein